MPWVLRRLLEHDADDAVEIARSNANVVKGSWESKPGGAQEDYDFRTKVLGFKNVKKTAFYDGPKPNYHFYYGNDTGEESSLVTTFPVAHVGVKGGKGSGQVGYVSLSIPEGRSSIGADI